MKRWTYGEAPAFHCKLRLSSAAPSTSEIVQPFAERSIETRAAAGAAVDQRCPNKHVTTALQPKARRQARVHEEKLPRISARRRPAALCTATGATPHHPSVVLPSYSHPGQSRMRTRSDVLYTHIHPEGKGKAKECRETRLSRSHEVGTNWGTSFQPKSPRKPCCFKNSTGRKNDMRSSCLPCGRRIHLAVAVSLGVASNLTCFSLGVLLLFSHYARFDSYELHLQYYSSYVNGTLFVCIHIYKKSAVTIFIIGAILLAEFYAACITIILSVDRVKAIRQHIELKAVNPDPPRRSAQECAVLPFKFICAFLATKKVSPETSTFQDATQHGMKNGGRSDLGVEVHVIDMLQQGIDMPSEPISSMTPLPAQIPSKAWNLHNEHKYETPCNEHVLLSNTGCTNRRGLSTRDRTLNLSGDNSKTVPTTGNESSYRECKWCRQTVDRQSHHVFLLGICAGKFNRRPLIVHLTLRLIRALFLFLCGTAVWMKTLFQPGLAAAVFSQAKYAGSSRAVTILSRCCLVATLSINVSLSLYLLQALVKNLVRKTVQRSAATCSAKVRNGEAAPPGKNASFRDAGKPLSKTVSRVNAKRNKLGHLRHQTGPFPRAALESNCNSSRAAALYSRAQGLPAAGEEELLPRTPLQVRSLSLPVLDPEVDEVIFIRSKTRSATNPHIAKSRTRPHHAAADFIQ